MKVPLTLNEDSGFFMSFYPLLTTMIRHYSNKSPSLYNNLTYFKGKLFKLSE